jgi:hypothetical protein
MLRIIFHLIGRKLVIKAWCNQGVMVEVASAQLVIKLSSYQVGS